MELVEVEIIAQVITTRYGTLSTGDVLKTDQAFADHLVNDCKGAKWPEPKVAAAAPAGDLQSTGNTDEVAVVDPATDLGTETLPVVDDRAPKNKTAAKLPKKTAQ